MMDNPNHADYSLVVWQTPGGKITWPSGFKYSNDAAHRLAKQHSTSETSKVRANCVVNVYLKAKPNV